MDAITSEEKISHTKSCANNIIYEHRRRVAIALVCAQVAYCYTLGLETLLTFFDGFPGGRDVIQYNDLVQWILFALMVVVSYGISIALTRTLFYGIPEKVE